MVEVEIPDAMMELINRVMKESGFYEDKREFIISGIRREIEVCLRLLKVDSKK